MLNKQNRLTRVNQLKTNKLFTSPFFSLRISNNQEKRIRFAFIVSKKTDQRAVARNKTKRILRSLVEGVISRIREGNDFVFIAKKNLTKEQANQALSYLQEILKKADVLKNE